MRNQKYIKKANIGNTLLSVPQAFTNAWVAVGGEINVQDFDMITLWLEQTANDSTDLQFKLVLLREKGGTEYEIPITSTEADRVKYQTQYYELNVDAVDTDIVERFEVTEAYSVKLYIKVGAVVGTAATMDSVYYDLSTAIA